MIQNVEKATIDELADELCHAVALERPYWDKVVEALRTKAHEGWASGAQRPITAVDVSRWLAEHEDDAVLVAFRVNTLEKQILKLIKNLRSTVEGYLGR